MLGYPKGPIIQIDRLIFDTRYQIKRKSVLPDVSPSSTICNFLTNSSKEVDSLDESHNHIQIIRLTLDDLKKRSSKTFVEKDKHILSPIYESIDEQKSKTNQSIEYSY